MIDGALAEPPRDRVVNGSNGYVDAMRVIDCECGQTLQAANDEDLFHVVRSHVNEEHVDTRLSDEQIRELIAERAYTATDA